MASQVLKTVATNQDKANDGCVLGGVGAVSPSELHFSGPHSPRIGDCSKFLRMDKFNLVDRSVYEVEDDELRVIPEVKEFILMGGVLGPRVLMKEMKEFIDQYWKIPGVIIQGRRNGIWIFNLVLKMNLHLSLIMLLGCLRGSIPLHFKDGNQV